MTPHQLLDLVDDLDQCGNLALYWLRECMKTDDHNVNEICRSVVGYAGHYANRLIDLAERGDSPEVHQQDRKLAAAGGER